MLVMQCSICINPIVTQFYLYIWKDETFLDIDPDGMLQYILCHQALPLYLRNSISPDCPFSLITCVSLLEYIMLFSNWHLAKKQVVYTSFPIICSDMSDWSTYQMHLYKSLSWSCRSRANVKWIGRQTISSSSRNAAPFQGIMDDIERI